MMGSSGIDTGGLNSLAALIADPQAALDRIASLQEAQRSFEEARDAAAKEKSEASNARALATDMKENARAAWETANAKVAEAAATIEQIKKRNAELSEASYLLAQMREKRHEDLEDREAKVTERERIVTAASEREYARLSKLAATLRSKEQDLEKKAEAADKIVSEYEGKIRRLREFIA